MRSDRSKTVVVLGMHRSGTSMIGGVLFMLGVDMGKKLLGKQWSNPLGHFEDKRFYVLNKRILQAAGGSWNSVPSAEAILAQEQKFAEDIRILIEKRNSEIWGWKDPRTNLTIELYLSYLTNPYFLVCHRNHEEIVKSLKRRDDMEHKENLGINEAKKLIEVYKRRIEAFFTKYSDLPKLDLIYDSVINEPQKWVKEIIEFLELESTEEQRRRAINFIKPKKEIEEIRGIRGKWKNERERQIKPNPPSNKV